MTPGLAKLMEEVAPEARRGLTDDLWRLAYTRNRTDIDRARPYLDRNHAGILVYSAAAGGGRTLAVIDTGDRLVAAIDRFKPARVGSAVRLVPASFDEPLTWRLDIDEAFPLDAEVRFDRAPSTRDERRWVDVLRATLEDIRNAEAIRRDAIAAQRRRLPPFEAPPSVETHLRERAEAVRREVLRATDFSAEERAELERLRVARVKGSYAEQKRAHEREQLLLRARQERFNEAMRTGLDSVKATVPEVRAARAAIVARNEAMHAALRRLEDADTESRARTNETAVAERYLDAFEQAPFLLELREPPAGLEDAERARDVLRAIALLSRALPRVANVRVAV